MSRTKASPQVLTSAAALVGVIFAFTGGLLPLTATSPPKFLDASVNSCRLERVGTQLVHCDNLTGAGVQAPTWIPEATTVPASDTCS